LSSPPRGSAARRAERLCLSALGAPYSSPAAMPPAVRRVWASLPAAPPPAVRWVWASLLDFWHGGSPSAQARPQPPDFGHFLTALRPLLLAPGFNRVATAAAMCDKPFQRFSPVYIHWPIRSNLNNSRGYAARCAERLRLSGDCLLLPFLAATPLSSLFS